jgi:hypothetical protein
MEQTTAISHRIPTDLKKAFDLACQSNDQTASQVIRALMRDYVKQNAQGDLLKGKK